MSPKHNLIKSSVRVEQPTSAATATYVPCHYLTFASFIHYKLIVIVVAKSLNLF